MSSFNRVILMGNLTRDPQLKYLPSGTAVCEFGLAVNRRYRDREGNQKEEVCFIDVTAFEKRGETINQYMSKGQPILIEGRLKLDTWTGQDGQKRSKHSVVVDNFQFVGGRRDQSTPGAEGGGAPAASNWQSAGGGGQPAAQDHGPPPSESPPTGENIPF